MLWQVDKKKKLYKTPYFPYLNYTKVAIFRHL